MTLPLLVLQSRTLNALRQAEGRLVPASDLVYEVYRGEDEPDYAEGCIRIAIMRLRQRGFPIATEHGRGYRFAGVGRIAG